MSVVRSWRFLRIFVVVLGCVRQGGCRIALALRLDGIVNLRKERPPVIYVTNCLDSASSSVVIWTIPLVG